jgi:hypothetical protein
VYVKFFPEKIAQVLAPVVSAVLVVTVLFAHVLVFAIFVIVIVKTVGIVRGITDNIEIITVAVLNASM